MILVVVVLLLAAFFIAFIAIAASADRAQRRAIDQADTELEELFAGTPPVVSYMVSMRSLPAETVIAAAVARGYRVEADSKSTYGPRYLTFVRG